jgi:hypothetical protein
MKRLYNEIWLVEINILFYSILFYLGSMCTVFSLAETPQLPPPHPPAHLSPYSRAMLVSHERRHLFVPHAGEGGVTPLPLTSTLSWQSKRQWVLFLEGQNCLKEIWVRFRSTVAATLKRVANK